jgi:hypothetical protein
MYSIYIFVLHYVPVLLHNRVVQNTWGVDTSIDTIGIGIGISICW